MNKPTLSKIFKAEQFDHIDSAYESILEWDIDLSAVNSHFQECIDVVSDDSLQIFLLTAEERECLRKLSVLGVFHDITHRDFPSEDHLLECPTYLRNTIGCGLITAIKQIEFLIKKSGFQINIRDPYSYLDVDLQATQEYVSKTTASILSYISSKSFFSHHKIKLYLIRHKDVYRKGNEKERKKIAKKGN